MNCIDFSNKNKRILKSVSKIKKTMQNSINSHTNPMKSKRPFIKKSR